MRLKPGILALFLLGFMAGHAQFKKGMKMAGANIASVVFNSGSSDIEVASIGSNTSKTTSYNINIGPSLGWFVSDKTVVGVTLTVNPYGQKVSYEQSGSTYQSDQTNSFNIGAGGFARNYFTSSGSLHPFVQASLNGGVSTLKTEGFFYGGSGSSAYKDTYTGKSNGGTFVNAAFTGGFTKMVGENAGLDFFLGYNFSYNKHTFKRTILRDEGVNGSVDTRSENETTTKFTNHGFLFGIGFQVFFGKK